MSRLGRRFPAPLRFGEPQHRLPPILSVPTEASITDTTVTIGLSTTSLSGTEYWYISESATPPSAADLKSGTGATKNGNTGTPLNPRTFDVTGLVAATTYYSYFIQNDGAVDSNLLESGSWATTGGGGVVVPVMDHHYRMMRAC